MRKWKCVSVNNGNERCFTVGKFYETDNNGYGVTVDSGTKIEYVSLLDEMKCYNGELQFVEVKDFIKSDLQECDVVVFRNEERCVYFDNAFLNKHNAYKRIEYYGDNLVRNDKTNKYDVMKVYRNGIIVFDRVEKSPIQIEIESIEEEQRKLADRLSELRKEL